MHIKKKKYALGYFDVILLLLFVIFICAATTSKIMEDDVFIHLVSGKYIYENNIIPSTDVLGFATEGTPWFTYEWAWQTATYVIWKAGGFEMLSVFRTVIIILIFLPVYIILRKLKIPAALFIILSVLMCTGILGRLVIRPHIISYLCFTLLVSVFYCYKYSGYKKRLSLYFIPFIFLIWANMHMGVILGIAVFSMFLFSESVTYAGRKKSFRKNKNIPPVKELKFLYIIFLVSLASVFINPRFAGTYLYVYGMLTNMPELKFINEWVSPFDGRFISGYYAVIYFIFLILGISILYYSYKTKEIFPALLYIVLGIFSTKSLRYTTDFTVLTLIPLIISLNYFFLNFKFMKRFLENRYFKAVLCFAMVIITVNIFNNSYYRMLNVPYRETGFGVSSSFFPVRLFDFMKEQKVCQTGSKPFNSMRIGGYFLWEFEGSRNFIDNRCLNGSTMNEYFDILLCKPGFREKLESYGIDYVVLNIPDFSSMLVEIELNIAAYLSANPDWKLVYWDDMSFLFVRNEDKFSKLINEYEYKYITPVNCIYHKEDIIKFLKSDGITVQKELNRKISADKNGIVINNLLNYLNSYIKLYSISR